MPHAAGDGRAVDLDDVAAGGERPARSRTSTTSSSALRNRSLTRAGDVALEQRHPQADARRRAVRDHVAARERSAELRAAARTIAARS